jgi:hypothetical protein
MKILRIKHYISIEGEYNFYLYYLNENTIRYNKFKIVINVDIKKKYSDIANIDLLRGIRGSQGFDCY